MLKEAQKRKVSITLQHMEKSLLEIEQRLKSDDYVGILYESRNDVPLQIGEDLLKKIVFIKEKMRKVSERFALEKEIERQSSEIFGEVSILWVSLEEIKAKRLKAYGEVDEGLEELLDPDIDAMIHDIFEMEHMVDTFRKKDK